VGQRPQEEALARKPELLIATPGRLLDLMNQGFVSLGGVEIFVLDEADRMLDMGFLPDVRRVIAALPKKRQTLLFSATVPPAIAELAGRILVNPAKVAVTPKVTAAETVDQSVYLVGRSDKRALLEQFLRAERPERVLVFARTKHGANRIAEHLAKAGVSAAAIHGNKSQGARERALGGFKTGDVQVLVATDIAARGIDVDGVSHVVNYELPTVPETYVHRIGRTGRAGATGVAIAYCDHEERPLLAAIERFLGKRLRVVGDAPAEPAQSPGIPHTPRQPPREEQPAGGYRAKPRRTSSFRRR
jgi:ATP-dependent RNA helicase RhlE